MIATRILPRVLQDCKQTNHWGPGKGVFRFRSGNSTQMEHAQIQGPLKIPILILLIYFDALPVCLIF